MLLEKKWKEENNIRKAYFCVKIAIKFQITYCFAPNYNNWVMRSTKKDWNGFLAGKIAALYQMLVFLAQKKSGNWNLHLAMPFSSKVEIT